MQIVLTESKVIILFFEIQEAMEVATFFRNKNPPIDAYVTAEISPSTQSGQHHVSVSYKRNEIFTNFSTEGFKGHLMPGIFRKMLKKY